MLRVLMRKSLTGRVRRGSRGMFSGMSIGVVVVQRLLLLRKGDATQETMWL